MTCSGASAPRGSLWRMVLSALLSALLPLLLLALATLPGGAAEERLMPWRYAQALQAVHEQLARGDRAAWRTRARLIRHMGAAFAEMPAATWRNKRNAQALLIYLLSGGDPAPARRLLSRGVKLPLPEGALEGALAYAEGRNGAAWKRLGMVPLEELSTSLRAQMLLARASLQASTHPRKALKLLDRVRLLAPGTLLEESALRRGMSLAGNEGDAKRFAVLANAYMRRFPRSYYMANFLHRAAWLLAQLDHGPEQRPLNRLLPSLKRLRKRQQALLLALVAREAVIVGKRSLTVLAGRKALALNAGTAAFRARVRTWMAAARVVSPSPEPALRTLRAVDASLLSPDDRRLRDAAMLVARGILAEPRPAPVASKEGGQRRKPGASGKDEDLPIIRQARAAVAEVAKLLEKSR